MIGIITCGDYSMMEYQIPVFMSTSYMDSARLFPWPSRCITHVVLVFLIKS